MKFVKIPESAEGPSRFYAVENPSRQTREYIRRRVPETHRYVRDCDNELVIHAKHVVAVGQIEITNSSTPLDCSELPQWAQDELEHYASDKRRITSNTTVTLRNDSAYSILYLIPTAPGYIVEAAWKAMVKMHHPDKGGDEEVFKRIAAAYEKIKER